MEGPEGRCSISGWNSARTHDLYSAHLLYSGGLQQVLLKEQSFNNLFGGGRHLPYKTRVPYKLY